MLSLALEIESLGKQLAISKSQTRNANELIDVWRVQALAAKDAIKEAISALRPAPWYTAPVLWVAIGFTVGAALVVAVVYALVPGVR